MASTRQNILAQCLSPMSCCRLPLLLLMLPAAALAVTMVDILSCNFDGMSLRIVRDPHAHKGLPYIAGHLGNKRCPRLVTGPTPNEWYMSWTTSQMQTGLCGHVHGANFTTQINIGHCDCDVMTGNDHVAVVKCIMLNDPSYKRASPGEPPDSAQFVLFSKTEVVPDLEDYALDSTVPPPKLAAIIRKADGYPVIHTDKLYIGQDLDVLIQITDDRDDFWIQLSVIDMYFTPIGSSNQTIGMIKSMCPGMEADDDTISGTDVGKVNDDYGIRESESLKACVNCQYAIQRFGVEYNPAILHGQSLAIPFKMFIFKDYPTGIEVHLKVLTCSAGNTGSCMRTDCPELSKKLLSFGLVSDNTTTTTTATTDSGGRYKRRYTNRRPVARYDVMFLLRLDPDHNSTSTNSSSAYIVFKPPPSLIPSLSPPIVPTTVSSDPISNRIMYGYTFVVKAALIATGVLVACALLAPLVYAMHRCCKKNAAAAAVGGDQDAQSLAKNVTLQDTDSSLPSIQPRLPPRAYDPNEATMVTMPSISESRYENARAGLCENSHPAAAPPPLTTKGKCLGCQSVAANLSLKCTCKNRRNAPLPPVPQSQHPPLLQSSPQNTRIVGTTPRRCSANTTSSSSSNGTAPDLWAVYSVARANSGERISPMLTRGVATQIPSPPPPPPPVACTCARNDGTYRSNAATQIPSPSCSCKTVPEGSTTPSASFTRPQSCHRCYEDRELMAK